MQATIRDLVSGNWLVVACQVRREGETARWMQYFGSIVFLPRALVEVRKTRHLTPNLRHRGLFKLVPKPLFPGYFFARELRGDPRMVPGFRCALRSNSIDQAVALLQETANHEHVIEVPRSSPIDDFRIGDVIRVTEGPFTAFGGVIVAVLPQRIDDADRIKADIEIFGRSTPVELYLDQIEVVAKVRHPKCSAREKIELPALV